MFPAEPDPKGDPATWTREDLRRWLAAVGAGSETGAMVDADVETEKSAPSRLRHQRAAARTSPGEYENPKAVGSQNASWSRASSRDTIDSLQSKGHFMQLMQRVRGVG